MVRELSLGERMKMELIAALLHRPRVLFLDEPTIGLHQRDNDRLIKTLQELRDLSNTIFVVEHDEDIMKAADMIIDIGPEGGEGGGHLVAKGTPEEVANTPGSYTGKYLKKVLKRK